MSDTAPAAAAAPPATVDPQDPLPESNWTYRRWFVILLTLALVAFMYYRSGTLAQVALSTDATVAGPAVHGMLALLRNDQILIGLLVLLYIAGASTEQVTKLVSTASLLKNVNFTSTSRAASPDGSTATASTASAPAAPAAPAAAEEPDLAP